MEKIGHRDQKNPSWHENLTKHGQKSNCPQKITATRYKEMRTQCKAVFTAM